MKFPCNLKNTLLIIRDRFGPSFATKGLVYLASLYLPLSLLLFARYKFPCYQTICYLQFQCVQKIPCWKPLVISFCSLLGSTLLLIKRTTIDPLYLWVINTLFWHHCRVVKCCWSVEISKEKFILRVEIYFHLLLWKTILWGVCSGYLNLD